MTEQALGLTLGGIYVCTLAQEVALPATHLGLAMILTTAITGSVAAVWAWFRSELADCKKDRIELYQRMDTLHDRVSALSLTVGRLQGPESKDK